MGSYFSGIQSWFGAAYQGRHLGLILREIGAKRPDALNNFISRATGVPLKALKGCRYEAEYWFKGRHGWRRADLAIVSNTNNEPLVLVEIKYRDKPLQETKVKPAQLSDYLFWKRQKRGRHVLVLSRDHLVHEGVVVKRWGAFVRELRGYASNSELVLMLVEYLEEEGVVMRDIDSRSLLGFMRRTLCGWRGAGVLVNNLNGPSEFSRLLQNMRLLAVPFDKHFKDAWSRAGSSKGAKSPAKSKCATIDFNIQNKLKTDNAEHIFEDGTLIDRSAKDGGRIYVVARYSLGHGHGKWLRVLFGLEFRIEPISDRGSMPGTYLFTEVDGAVIDHDQWRRLYLRKKIKFEHVTSGAEHHTESIEKKVYLLLIGTLDRLYQENASLTKEQKKAVRLLLKSLSK